MKTIAHSLIISLPMLLATVAFAQHQTFTVNPDSSTVTFTLAGTGHHVQGTFHAQSGLVEFDRSATKISGSIVVAAGSGNSGEASRDKKNEFRCSGYSAFCRGVVRAAELSRDHSGLRRFHGSGHWNIHSSRHAT